MNTNKHAIQRLTILWAFNEAGLGGLLHAFRLPFTGLLVGGIAIVLITLIASYSKERFRDILKATILVLLVKAAVSPHTPVMAYLAVSFQGLVGALLFGLLPGYRLPALLLGVLALVESALQKLFTLTVIYGQPLWDALDAFFHYAGKQLGVATDGLSLSAGLIMGYVGIYVVGGIVVGIVAGRMVSVIAQLPQKAGWGHLNLSAQTVPAAAPGSRQQRRWIRYVVVLTTMAIMLAFVRPGESPGQMALYAIVRSLVVVVVWWMVVAPLLKGLVAMFLRKQRSRYADALEEALALLPVLRRAAVAVWRESSGRRGLRLWYFLVMMIHFTLTWQSTADEA